MSPKLYEAISEKFHGVWGDYACWAHSVSFPFRSKEHTDLLSSGIIHCGSEGILRLRSPHSRPFAEETRWGHILSLRRHFIGWSSFSTQSAKQVQTQDAPKLREGLHIDDTSPAEASSLAEL